MNRFVTMVAVMVLIGLCIGKAEAAEPARVTQVDWATDVQTKGIRMLLAHLSKPLSALRESERCSDLIRELAAADNTELSGDLSSSPGKDGITRFYSLGYKTLGENARVQKVKLVGQMAGYRRYDITFNGDARASQLKKVGNALTAYELSFYENDKNVKATFEIEFETDSKDPNAVAVVVTLKGGRFELEK